VVQPSNGKKRPSSAGESKEIQSDGGSFNADDSSSLSSGSSPVKGQKQVTFSLSSTAMAAN